MIYENPFNHSVSVVRELIVHPWNRLTVMTVTAAHVDERSAVREPPARMRAWTPAHHGSFTPCRHCEERSDVGVPPRLFSPPKIIMNSFSEATHDWGMSFPVSRLNLSWFYLCTSNPA
jgi:hypothetical protein